MMDTELETLRSRLQSALDDAIERLGPASPTVQILSHALLRGDRKTLSAALALCRPGGDSVRLPHA